ncbi:hypothetical protein EA472_15595 [Natrarchaeobius oligotrophus]|uniref:Uncharacterized protein n=1 Tax=Natrarchaeobius chitinivorans TaxID=1679083 RepID=A0A3N6MVM1_NATCH|nr:hypothetical protein EA472_15595 [Natrarchaeobius chitinivorans]
MDDELRDLENHERDGGNVYRTQFPTPTNEHAHTIGHPNGVERFTSNASATSGSPSEDASPSRNLVDRSSSVRHVVVSVCWDEQ